MHRGAYLYGLHDISFDSNKPRSGAVGHAYLLILLEIKVQHMVFRGQGYNESLPLSTRSGVSALRNADETPILLSIHDMSTFQDWYPNGSL